MSYGRMSVALFHVSIKIERHNFGTELIPAV